MRTCGVFAILTLACGACGFDPSGLGTPPIADASAPDPPSTTGPDAALAARDAGDPIDASRPDAMPPDGAPDAAPPCGHLGEACCVPDDSCGLGICLNDVCVSLSR